MVSLVPEINTLEDDLPHAKPADGGDNWTESFIFWIYLADGRHFYVHFHRYPPVSTVWRCLATVCNDDGTVLGYQHYGQELSLQGPGFQQCHAICDKPYESWQLHVDTVMQQTTRDALRKEQISAFDHSCLTHFKLDLQVTSNTPTYEPMSYSGARGSNANWTHFTPCRAKGTIAVGTESRQVDCLAYRDHSVGPRDFSRMNDDGYGLVGVFPGGKSFMAMGSYDKDGSAGFSIGGITQNGRLSYADKIKTPAFRVPEPNTELGRLVIETEQGTANVNIRFLDPGMVFELSPPCLHSLGLRGGLQDVGLLSHEHRIEVEWDGEIGVGSYQGSARE